MKKTIFCIAIIMLTIFFSTQEVNASLTGTVNVNDSLNLRASASTSSNVITSFSNGTILTILDTNGGSCDGGGSWYKVSYGNYSGYDYSSFEFYSDWGSDYLWLPSLTEMGYSDTYVGLWALNTEERKNYDGINDTAVSGSVPGSSSNTGSGTATYSAFWSRSVSADNSCNVVSISTSGIGYGVGGFVDASGAIRPALHLNLSALSSATAAPASVGITNTIHDDNIEPLNYDVTILDSTGATVYSYAFQLTTETQSTCTLIEGRTYKIVVQAPAGYSTSIQLGEQYYYTKVLSFVATDNMNINVNTRLRSQGWFDDVTIY